MTQSRILPNDLLQTVLEFLSYKDLTHVRSLNFHIKECTLIITEKEDIPSFLDENLATVSKIIIEGNKSQASVVVKFLMLIRFEEVINSKHRPVPFGCPSEIYSIEVYQNFVRFSSPFSWLSSSTFEVSYFEECSWFALQFAELW